MGALQPTCKLFLIGPQEQQGAANTVQHFHANDKPRFLAVSLFSLVFAHERADAIAPASRVCPANTGNQVIKCKQVLVPDTPCVTA